MNTPAELNGLTRHPAAAKLAGHGRASSGLPPIRRHA